MTVATVASATIAATANRAAIATTTVAAAADKDRAGIDTAVLPPAIGRPERAAEGEAADEAPAAKPRRTRRTLAARGSDVEAAE